MKPVKFGTDGWRGVIADDFTFDRVAIVTEAIGEYLHEEGTAGRGVAIGYDNRFASEDIAGLAAAILTRQGISVKLADHSLPTPVISHAIKRYNLGGGIVITASHNPAKYSGVKFKPWFAGSASTEATLAIEHRANTLLENTDIAALRSTGARPELLSREDFIPDYIQEVLGFVNADVIRARRPRLYIDPLYGASLGVLDRALHEAGCEVLRIHSERNPIFGGLNPEPIAENLGPLMAAVQETRVSAGIASDGDGDRLGAVAEDGAYVSPHHLFALLLIHLVENHGLRGGVVKTVSTSTMIDQLAERYQLSLYETPIGFKYICQLMLEKDILIGGEESGGIGIGGHIPERDATLAALLLVEMMAVHATSLGGLLALLRERVGDHEYGRIDLHLQRPVTAEQFAALRRALPSSIYGVGVRNISERDGMKFILDDGSWLLLRASGTEPVLRIYAEADSSGKVRQLLDFGNTLVIAGQIPKAA